LDADDVPLYSNKFKKQMERDIVQFVPFREFKHNPEELAKQTLEEIPKQLVSFMNSKHIPPKREFLSNMTNYSFFDAQKNAMVNMLKGMGFTDEKIMEMFAKGIPENSADLFKIHAFNPYFRNMLAEGCVGLK